MPESAASVAAKLSFIVERRWREQDALDPRDLTDIFLFLSYPRAYRCFQSIRRLCDDPDSDGQDPLILTRALVSLVLRSLWPTESGSAKEREERANRRHWYTVIEERKRLRALGDPTDAAYLSNIERDVRDLEVWFNERGMKPSELSEADIAKKLELDMIYDLIFRLGSATTHHSQLAALGSFADRINPGDPFPPLPLRYPKAAEVENVLLWAITVYAIFLEKAEQAVKLGVGPEVEALVEPWLREQHRLAQDRSKRDSD